MHLMLDWETLGNGPDTIVLSLGAVAFNKDGIVADALFEFDLFDQVKKGRSFTSSTLQWWMKQSDSAREVFKDNDFKRPIDAFIRDFEAFADNALNKVGEKRDQLKPWGNGANFDISILEDIYRRHHPRQDQGIPWKYWNVWCFRTFDHLTGCKNLIRRVGTHHNALDDARHQAACVMAWWKQQDAKAAQRASAAP